MINAVTGVGNSAGFRAMPGASAGMPPMQKMTSLYNQIATSSAGSITQDQFSQAFQTFNLPPVFQRQGAGAIFSALDPNGGTGSGLRM